MIGGALVGTFLGVFLAYGLVGPFATRVKAVTEEDNHFYLLIREVLIANLHNHPANICIEVGRQNTPHHMRPSFGDLEEALRILKQDAA
jgi:chemotaxis protein MotA